MFEAAQEMQGRSVEGRDMRRKIRGQMSSVSGFDRR